MNKKILYNNIGASLKEGIVFKKTTWILMWSLLAFSLSVPVGSMVYFILVLFGIEIFTTEEIIPIIGANIVTLLISAGIVFVLIKKGRLRQKIYLCLDDAVEIYAKTVAISRIYSPIRPATKLMVKFCYNKQKYIFYSGDPNKNYYLIRNHGYYKILERYIGEKVKILYSPKYDEVFFLIS